jgi:hypothetical protein
MELISRTIIINYISHINVKAKSMRELRIGARNISSKGELLETYYTQME